LYGAPTTDAAASATRARKLGGTGSSTCSTSVRAASSAPSPSS